MHRTTTILLVTAAQLAAVAMFVDRHHRADAVEAGQRSRTGPRRGRRHGPRHRHGPGRHHGHGRHADRDHQAGHGHAGGPPPWMRERLAEWHRTQHATDHRAPHEPEHGPGPGPDPSANDAVEA